MNFNTDGPTLVTGGTGMLGHAISAIDDNIVTIGSADGDLRDYHHCLRVFHRYRPSRVIHLAAKVGGVKGNANHLGDYYRDNVLINTNVLECARLHGVEKLLSVMSTCVYPDAVTYPLTEPQIHAGLPHPSNYAYAYAKRMLDIQSRAYREQYGCNFITTIPNNMFGPNDNYDKENGHVIPSLIRKIHEAKLAADDKVTLWGDGTALRGVHIFS